MRHRIINHRGVWLTAIATVAVAAGSRLTGLALGKAVTFGYAVIVSLAANFAIDLVRAPADNLLHEAALLLPNRAGVEARAAAALPAPPTLPARPGPGSGGLY